MAVSIWLLGFIWFITLIPSSQHLQMAEPTEAVIVFTGGKGRVEQGVALLRAGKAKWLFISGVHQNSDKTAVFEQFRRMYPAEYRKLESRMVLGRQAVDTIGNARESAEWVRKNGFHTLRLVTANYHMPRSLLEFKRKLPEASILSTAVFTDRFRDNNWWQDKQSLLLVISEYHKYTASRIYGWISKYL